MDGDGSNRRELTGDHSDRLAVCSPDGSYVAFRPGPRRRRDDGARQQQEMDLRVCSAATGSAANWPGRVCTTVAAILPEGLTRIRLPVDHPGPEAGLAVVPFEKGCRCHHQPK